MNFTHGIFIGLALGFVYGVACGFDMIRNQIQQPSPAQRRAMREDCRKKGL